MNPELKGLPKAVNFEGVKNRFTNDARCYYELVEFRAPLKGEFYLSGAIVMAYRAKNSLSTAYWIVRPTQKVESRVAA